MVDIHRSEEETVEAIKRWWKENGVAVVSGIAIGVALIVGVRYWWTYQQTQAEESSQVYSELLQQKNLGNSQQLQQLGSQLKQDYSGTPYATFAAFALAEAAIKDGQLDKALSEYRWAVDNAPHAALEHLARVRLARVLVDNGQHDQALQIIDKRAHEAFEAQYGELSGDIHKAKGNIQQARSAYQQAVAAAGGAHRQLIEMKLHSLTQVAASGSDDSATDAAN